MSIILSLSSRKKASTLLPGKTNIHTHTKKKKKEYYAKEKERGRFLLEIISTGGKNKKKKSKQTARQSQNPEKTDSMPP